MKTSAIVKMYEKNYSRVEIAEELIWQKEVDTFDDAMQVVEEVILQCKHLKNRVGGTFD